MKILSLYIPPVFPAHMTDFRGTQKMFISTFVLLFFHTMKVNDDRCCQTPKKKYKISLDDSCAIFPVFWSQIITFCETDMQVVFNYVLLYVSLKSVVMLMKEFCNVLSFSKLYFYGTLCHTNELITHLFLYAK